MQVILTEEEYNNLRKKATDNEVLAQERFFEFRKDFQKKVIREFQRNLNFIHDPGFAIFFDKFMTETFK